MTIKTPFSTPRRSVSLPETPAVKTPKANTVAEARPALAKGRPPVNLRPETRFDIGQPARRRTDAIPADRRVPQPLRENLSSTEQAKLDKVESGEASRFARDNVDRLTGTDAYARLDRSTQTRVLRDFLATPDASISHGFLASLTNSEAFAELTPSQRAQALDVFKATNSAGQARLVELAQREVNGRPALLDVDAEGQTLLSRLESLATGELSNDFERSGVEREALLASILAECADPGEVEQASKNTCTVTCMQYQLCEQNPAEYVRLMEGMVTGDGRVAMRSGAELRVERDALPPDDEPRRSASERIFQAAMMEYSNGGESYSNATDKSSGKRFFFFSYQRDGLIQSQQERGLEALFGRNFTNRDNDVVDLLSDRSPLDTYVRMKWGEDKRQGHAVVVTRVENGRVYFRNPWGPTSDPVGTTYSDPPRQLENRHIREESMTVDEFERWAKSAIV